MKRDMRIAPLLHFLFSFVDLIRLPAQNLDSKAESQYRRITSACGGKTLQPLTHYPGS